VITGLGIGLGFQQYFYIAEDYSIWTTAWWNPYVCKPLTLKLDHNVTDGPTDVMGYSYYSYYSRADER